MMAHNPYNLQLLQCLLVVWYEARSVCIFSCLLPGGVHPVGLDLRTATI